MKRIMAMLLSALLLTGAAHAQEGELDARVRALREAVAQAPFGQETLGDSGFAPLEMDSDAISVHRLQQLFDADGRGYSAGAERLDSRWSFTDSSGRTITVVVCDGYGDAVCVFERETSGEERLLDVLFGVTAHIASPRLVELWDGRYLLTTTYGHGTGTYRLWTNWYNLDTRRMELHTVREGYEGDGDLFAHIVTLTNVDDPQDLDPAFPPETLVTAAYVTVSRMDDQGRYALLDDDCTVTAYVSTDGGLRRQAERVFDEYAPALIEQADADDLLDPAWGVAAGETELLDTAGLYDGQIDARTVAEAVIPALREAKVTGVEWVNMREEGDKRSPAIAAVGASEKVYILKERQGFENGWTQALYLPEGEEPPVIGYIWRSFLEEIE